MKKLLALLLSVLVVISLFAGCGGGGNDDTTPGNNDATQGTQGDDSVKATWPEDLTLTIGLANNALVEDHDTNAFTLWLEEQTGIDIQFQKYQPLENDYRSQLSVAMVDGEELPDLIIGLSLGRGVFQEYGEDGYFIDLAPFFEDKELSGEWWERFNTLEEGYKDYITRNMTSDDGETIYVFPTIETSPYDIIDYQAFINQEWLNKLNLPMPTDIDSLYTTLKAFKTQDPNGNGKADEYPLMGSTTNGVYGDVVSWIINMYTFYDDSQMWRVAEDGTFSHIYASDAYREGLKTIHKWYKEGLLAWNDSSENVKNLINPADDVATLGIYLGHPTIVGMNSKVFMQYEAMPYWGCAVENQHRNHYTCHITSDCEYPEAAWEILMLMSSLEGGYRQRYGELGVDWEWSDGGKSFLDWDAEIKVINPSVWSNIGNACWQNIQASILLAAENETVELSEDSAPWVQHKFKIMADCYNNFQEAKKNNPDNIPRYIVYTVEQEEEVTHLRANCKDWILNARVGFCKGNGEQFNDPNNDAQWNAYVAGIEAQGMTKWMGMAEEIYAETYGTKG